MNQQLHDSGKRREFSTGAVRDRGDLKPRPDLISPHAQMREGMIHALGSEKYDLRNWELGMPISECLASAQRHIEQYKRGDTDEDHIAQARWNLGAIIHYEEEIKAGRLPADLDDMPKYAKTTTRICNRCSTLFPVGNVCPNHPMEDDTDPDTKIDYSIVQMFSKDDPSTWYVAGPMRGYKDLNFAAFDAVAKLARSQGYNIISPAEMDRENGIDPIKDPESVKRAFDNDPNLLQAIVRRDTEVIINLKKDRGDGLILLPYWQNSTGTRAEVALALWLELTFKRAIFVDKWILEDIEVEWVKHKLFGSQ